ncbi:NAD(P)-binding protein [Hypoxylon trugodes]|uniref:NAD(P)-binding protein n=1 Tax=Hypoxylon trugodes TaxID=326681 RepID=UPI002198160D|nr:NAD(P)-binding protein [Hypoxylon trugodes]KAI1392510.1 NAD(P)-binding protein [Hypoxylon trugodes]
MAAKFSSKLTGKHVLVIGGTKGIGRGVVEGSIEAGARVTISGSSQKSVDVTLSEVKAEYPDAPVTGVPCDLSKETVEQDLEALFTEVEKQQPIDHVVLTAADVLPVMKVEDFSYDKIRKGSHMRFILPILLGKITKRHVAASVNNSLTISTGGIAEKPNAGWSVAAYMGAGLTGLARNLALDLAPLRVNAVEPGFVDTPLWEVMGLDAAAREREFTKWGKLLPTGKVGQVVDVAEAYLYLMRDQNATGEIVKTRGGHNLI